MLILDGSNPFVDLNNLDFQLLEGTSAIDAGTVNPGITDGFWGLAPDVGAYEFGQPGWVPGSTLVFPVDNDYFAVAFPIPEPTSRGLALSGLL